MRRRDRPGSAALRRPVRRPRRLAFLPPRASRPPPPAPPPGPGSTRWPLALRGCAAPLRRRLDVGSVAPSRHISSHSGERARPAWLERRSAAVLGRGPPWQSSVPRPPRRARWVGGRPVPAYLSRHHGCVTCSRQSSRPAHDGVRGPRPCHRPSLPPSHGPAPRRRRRHRASAWSVLVEVHHPQMGALASQRDEQRLGPRGQRLGRLSLTAQGILHSAARVVSRPLAGVVRREAGRAPGRRSSRSAMPCAR